MKIAVIGGGASGIVSAYLLQDAHEVHVFEKQDMLGGHVRTLGRNVSAPGLPGNIHIENGVLGFHRATYPNLHKLFAHLGTPLSERRPSSALYREGQFFPKSVKALQALSTRWKVLTIKGYIANLKQMRAHAAKTMAHMFDYDASTDPEIQTLLGDSPVMNDLLTSLLSLAFSTPFEEVGTLPASLTVPYLRGLTSREWTAVNGGVFSYFETILSHNRFKVHLNAGDVTVRRRAGGITVTTNGRTAPFDHAIIASSPGQVLRILDDADKAEQRLFTPWADRTFKTMVHTETAFYKPFTETPKTPMDVFVDYRGSGRGYNTYMNGFYGLPDTSPYSFAYNLDALVPEEKILNVQHHTVPVYSVAGAATKADIIARSGEGHISFAGAYLGNGLHEGAISSAMAVARELGGLTLD